MMTLKCLAYKSLLPVPLPLTLLIGVGAQSTL